MVNKLKYIWLLIVFLFGCTQIQTSLPTSIQVRPTQTAKLTNTEIPFTPTEKPEPTWTLPASLSPKDAASQVNELLQTNGGCHLPCWWGITPGQTTWEDARNIIFPLAESVYDSYSKEGEFFPGLVIRYITERGTGFEQDYTVRNEIVQAIKIKLPYTSPLSNPKVVLDNYGMPDKVYVEANNYEPSVDNEQAFSIALYYTKQRIFVYYDNGFEPAQPGPTLVLCFPNVDYSELHVWGSEYSFNQTLDTIFQKDRENGSKIHSLEDATDLTIEELYKRFTDPTESPCFETPADKWLP